MNLGSLRRVATVVAAAIGFLTLGCASATIQATRDPRFTGKMSRIYVLLNHGQVDQVDSRYTTALVTALRNEFSRRNVTITVTVVDQLALRDDAYAQDIARYQSDGVLTIKTSGGVIGAYGGLHTIIYDVSLMSPEQPDGRVWRAKITADGGTAVIEKKMNYVAQELVNRLGDDRLLI